MKIAAFGLVGVLLIVLVGSLIGPQVYDWNRHKADIVDQVRSLTGRQLTINGDLTMRLLPSPRLTVADVSLANAPEGVAADIAQIRYAEVELAFWPLLRLGVDVRLVRLVDPVIAVESLADGRWNWEVTAVATHAAAEDSAGSDGGRTTEPPPSPPESLPVRLDSVEIVNGQLTFHDHAAATVEHIEGLTASIRAASLQGPAEARGTARVRGVPFRFEAAIGNVAARSVVPVKVDVSTADDNARVAAHGFLSELASDPRFDGTLRTEGDVLASAIHAIHPQPLPGFLAQAFLVDGELQASASDVSFRSKDMRLGDTAMTVRLDAAFANDSAVDVDVRVGRIDVDTWSTLPPVRPEDPDRADSTEAGAQADEVSWVASQPVEGPDQDSMELVSLPDGIDVQVGVAVEALAFRGGVIREAVANARLDGGEVTLNQLAAKLPGGADVAVFGFVTAANGRLRFDGDMDVRAPDMSSALAWLGVDANSLAHIPLRSLTATGKIALTTQQVQARQVVIALDGSIIEGDLEFSFAERPKLETALAIDRIDLDGLLADPRRATAFGAAPSADLHTDGYGMNDEGPTTAEAADAVERLDPPSVAGTIFKELDADIQVLINTLTWNGASAAGVNVDASLRSGDVTIRRAAIDDLAGARTNLTGRLVDAGGTPWLDRVQIEAEVPDAGRLARALGQSVPTQVSALGPVDAQAVVSGNAQGAAIEATLRARTATLELTGSASLTPDFRFTGTSRLRTDDSAPLVSVLAPNYRPVGPFGPTSVSADLAIAPMEIALDALVGTVAGIDLTGSIQLDTATEPINVRVDLTTDDVEFDRFKPAQQRAQRHWDVTPASWAAVPVATDVGSGVFLASDVHPRWSRRPIDLTALGAVNGLLKWQSKTASLDKFTASDVQLSASLEESTLTIPSFTASAWGGAMQGSGSLDAKETPAFAVDLSLADASLKHLAGDDVGGVQSGTLSISLQATGGGASEWDLVSSLIGTGRFRAQGLQATPDAASLPLMGPVLQAFGTLQTTVDRLLRPVVGATGTPRVSPGEAGGEFEIMSGIVSADDISFRSPLIAGDAQAQMNLPAWTVAVEGTAHLDASFASTVSAGLVQVPGEIRFETKGSLDNPKFKVRANTLKIIAPKPGISDGNQLKPNVNDVLEQILPDLGQRIDQPDPRPRVDDLLRDVFR